MKVKLLILFLVVFCENVNAQILRQGEVNTHRYRYPLFIGESDSMLYFMNHILPYKQDEIFSNNSTGTIMKSTWIQVEKKRLSTVSEEKLKEPEIAGEKSDWKKSSVVNDKLALILKSDNKTALATYTNIGKGVSDLHILWPSGNFCQDFDEYDEDDLLVEFFSNTDQTYHVLLETEYFEVSKIHKYLWVLSDQITSFRLYDKDFNLLVERKMGHRAEDLYEISGARVDRKGNFYYLKNGEINVVDRGRNFEHWTYPLASRNAEIAATLNFPVTTLNNDDEFLVAASYIKLISSTMPRTAYVDGELERQTKGLFFQLHNNYDHEVKRFKMIYLDSLKSGLSNKSLESIDHMKKSALVMREIRVQKDGSYLLLAQSADERIVYGSGYLKKPSNFYVIKLSADLDIIWVSETEIKDIKFILGRYNFFKYLAVNNEEKMEILLRGEWLSNTDFDDGPVRVSIDLSDGNTTYSQVPASDILQDFNLEGASHTLNKYKQYGMVGNRDGTVVIEWSIDE